MMRSGDEFGEKDKEDDGGKAESRDKKKKLRQ
jgi:hypothetical protein